MTALRANSKIFNVFSNFISNVGLFISIGYLPLVIYSLIDYEQIFHGDAFTIGISVVLGSTHK